LVLLIHVKGFDANPCDQDRLIMRGFQVNTNSTIASSPSAPGDWAAYCAAAKAESRAEKSENVSITNSKRKADDASGNN